MMVATAVENFRLSAALDYARRGWRVFPVHWPRIGGSGASCSCGRADCHNVGKHPITGHGLHDATADAETLRKWWEEWPAASVAVATGAVSGIVVLDVDPRHGGDRSLVAAMDRHGELPETVEAVTGGGGRHFFFAHPGSKVPNSGGADGWLGMSGLDVKGDGGYVVAAPSLHASGRRYAWEQGAGPADGGLAVLPQWLMPPAPQRPRPSDHRDDREDAGTHWLGKALAKATAASRNDTGLWLALQLRDSGMAVADAEPVMADYAARVPGSDHPYREREALATLRSAYSRPAREQAKSGAIRINPSATKMAIEAPAANAATELRDYLHAVASGKISDARLPWPLLSRWSCSMLPGTVTAVVGDPGVGKTFLTLECLRWWHGNGNDVAVFFVEKDRRFHTQRLLAQLEGNGKFVDYEWLPGKSAEIDDAISRHGAYIAELGKSIHSASGDDVNLGDLLNWVRQMASAGKRVLVIDPVTAADAGRERWEADRQFMVGAQKVCAAHDASLVLITHPRRGNRPASGGTLHDVAGGAAFVRLADTVLWLNKPKKSRKVYVKAVSSVGVKTTVEKCGLFVQLHKTRNGRGNGMELAYSFGDGLHFCEHGMVTGEAKDGGEEGEAA